MRVLPEINAVVTCHSYTLAAFLELAYAAYLLSHSEQEL